MERIKHHYCWVKVVEATAQDVDSAGAAGPMPPNSPDTRVGMMPIAWTPRPGFGVGAIQPRSVKPPPDSSTVGRNASPRSLKPPPDSLMEPTSTRPPPDIAFSRPVEPASTRPPPDAPSDGSIGKASTKPPPDSAQPKASRTSRVMTPPPAPKRGRRSQPASVGGRNATTRVDLPTDGRAVAGEHSSPDGAAVANWMFGGATFVAGWNFEEPAIPGLDGGHGLAIVYQPIVGSREDAFDWIASAAGRQWCQDALKVSLMSFVAMGDL